MKPRWVLGLDTSSYTTSAAVADLAGNLAWEARLPLAVAPGKRGLRQSEALFQHVRNLPELLTAHLAARPLPLAAVAASTRPRPVPGSYMPVFLAGAAVGRSVAAALGVPFYGVSHQEGHLHAGLWSAGGPCGSFFVALHASGGTTELVAVRRQDGRLRLRSLATTSDLYAGQFVDRVGVKLGLPFPAGPHLEALARSGRPGVVTLPVAVTAGRLSLSGPQSAAERALAGGAAPADLALAAETCLAESLARWAAHWCRARGAPALLAVGGVMANGRVRAALARELAQGQVPLFVCAPSFSVDNGVGVALAGAGRLAAQGEESLPQA